ncbi:MAG: bifunctional 4-hydroxy-2-oxoglutarate aldolase/2-dehydro-3-deoxy-phosphogluconate aldolase [Clostridia bacterium]|nr:bifunctional 4-hydroxy-2-oxoglutarate aldolase/2-dehydro-3-deoxy-phosphogluconate aldolase [Clostridia bacterium]
MMDRLSRCGIVPVAVLDKAENAVPTANALLAGGIDIMEVTFRTDAAAESIQLITDNCPDVLVGAGTIITLDQCKTAVNCGARFIVSPGFDYDVVSWCVENSIPVIPGCVTPTEITAALRLGLKVLKFFPAGIYGGLAAMKALSGPFGGIKFIPTGGVNAQNIGDYIAAPYVHAIGGSWVCSKEDIAAGNFDRITQLSRQAKASMLGFEVAHIGINCQDASQADEICEKFCQAFGFEAKSGSSSIFSTSSIEVIKSVFLGEHGHIAIRTNSIQAAVAELEKRGFTNLPDTAKYKNDRMIAIYLKDEFGGFAVHLLQK